jgi:hypothetical protein
LKSSSNSKKENSSHPESDAAALETISADSSGGEKGSTGGPSSGGTGGGSVGAARKRISTEPCASVAPPNRSRAIHAFNGVDISSKSTLDPEFSVYRRPLDLRIIKQKCEWAPRQPLG